MIQVFLNDFVFHKVKIMNQLLFGTSGHNGVLTALKLFQWYHFSHNARLKVGLRDNWKSQKSIDQEVQIKSCRSTM